jgi:hypothetical protein
MPEPLLIVMNPRRIPECMEAINDLPISKLWLERYTEHEISSILPDLIDECDYDPIGILSDDGIPSRESLALVLQHYTEGEVITGYCNLDETSDRVNLSTESLVIKSEATMDSYTMPSRDYIESHPDERIRSWFAGHCLTFMSRELWQKYPFIALGGGRGMQSDYYMCCRLQEDDVPIYAARGAFVHHVKTRVNEDDYAPGRELLIGVEPSLVRWDRCESSS